MNEGPASIHQPAAGIPATAPDPTAPGPWRLWLYAAFYFAIPSASVVGERLDGVSLSEIDGAQWIVIGICSFVAGATSCRAFFDSSFARFNQNPKPKDTP